MEYNNICCKCKKNPKLDNRKKCQICLNEDSTKTSIRLKEKEERGECYYCTKSVENGRRLCEVHLEKRRLYGKQRRKDCCERCGGPKEKGGLCFPCWNRRTINRKLRAEGKKITKTCQVCRESANSGRLCDRCRLLDKCKSADRRTMRIEACLCPRCGKSVEFKGDRCNLCYSKDIAHYHFKNRKKNQELLDLLENQNYICPYTGQKLILGRNTTLDHKIPKSRGGLTEISNLQWVYKGDFDVNWMKGMMTDSEFKLAIKTLFFYMSKDVAE